MGSGVTAVSVVLAIALVTAFQMVVGELVPKTIAIERPYRDLDRLSRAVSVWGLIARPIILDVRCRRELDGAAAGNGTG